MITLMVFSLITLYGLIYLMVAVSSKFRQVAVTEDIFEDIKVMRQEYGSTTSDVLAAALNSMRRELAKRNALKG